MLDYSSYVECFMGCGRNCRQWFPISFDQTSPVLNGYGVMTTSNLEQKVWITEKIWNTITNTLYDKFNA